MSENMTALLHIRINPSLLAAIQEMADLLHINYREYVRTRLAQIVHEERRHYDNSFAPRPERERQIAYPCSECNTERPADELLAGAYGPVCPEHVKEA